MCRVYKTFVATAPIRVCGGGSGISGSCRGCPAKLLKKFLTRFQIFAVSTGIESGYRLKSSGFEPR